MHSTSFAALSLAFLALASAQPLSPPTAETLPGERQELTPVATATSGWGMVKALPDPEPSAIAPAPSDPAKPAVIPGHIPINWAPSSDIPSGSIFRTDHGKKTTFGHDDSLDDRPDVILANVVGRDTPHEDHGAEEALARDMGLKDRLVTHELEVNDMTGHGIGARSDVKPFAPGPLLFLGKDGDWYTIGMMRASTVPGLAGMRFGPA